MSCSAQFGDTRCRRQRNNVPGSRLSPDPTGVSLTNVLESYPPIQPEGVEMSS